MSIHAARSARARIKSLKTFLPPPEAMMARKDEFSTWFETEESVVCCRGADWCADDDMEGDVSVTRRILHGRESDEQLHIRHKERHLGAVFADDENGFDVYLVGPVRLTDEKEGIITLSDALTRAILGLGSVVPMTGHEALELQHTASMASRIAERASSLDTFTAYCMQERSSRRA